MPAIQEIIGVTGNGIREWRVEAGSVDGRKTLLVLPEKPLRDDYSLRLSLEAPIAQLPGEVRVPELEIVGAAYARGEVAVRAEAQLDAIPKNLSAAMRTQAANGGTGHVGTFRLLNNRIS